jgi:hypothetical protein
VGEQAAGEDARDLRVDAARGLAQEVRQGSSAQPLRARSFSYMAAGKASCFVQSWSAPGGSLGMGIARTCGMRFTWRMPLAASPQGLGTPGTTTRRSPGRARASVRETGPVASGIGISSGRGTGRAA